MKSALVILSSQYCGNDLTAEFGTLPPAMLPVGAKRLFEHQVERHAEAGEKIILTLPESYALPRHDAQLLDQQGVSVIWLPESMSLVEAVSSVLTNTRYKRIALLFGDTLLLQPPQGGDNLFTVAKTLAHYPWSSVDRVSKTELRIVKDHWVDSEEREVLCGYFVFDQVDYLLECCTESETFDKALTMYAAANPVRIASVENWLDFGHRSTFYQSRRSMLVSRSFNSISVDGHRVTKTSSDKKKIAAESRWFENLPTQLKIYIPHHLNLKYDSSAYSLEYLYLPTLAELSVFASLPSHSWRLIVNSCAEFLIEAQQAFHCQSEMLTSPPELVSEKLIGEKSRERVAEFLDRQSLISEDVLVINGCEHPPLSDVVDQLISLIPPTTVQNCTVMHGDFFFGNILFDFTSERIKVIDPRGCFTPEFQGMVGDIRYDIAKLAHSVIGGYDNIIAGRFSTLKIAENRYQHSVVKTTSEISREHLFKTMVIKGHDFWNAEIQAITALLFLSMLPLHSDDKNRQEALMCTGLEIAQGVLNPNRK